MNSDSMKKMWNKRAEKDAFYYVESAFWDGNISNFFALGEERVRLLVDPYLSLLTVPEKSACVLEIGCGLGRFSRSLSQRFQHVIGVDVSDEMIRQAKELNPSSIQNLEFKATDGSFYPFINSNSIDFVFSYEVFQHMPSSNIVSNNFKEINRVLKADGVALIHVMTDDGCFIKTAKKLIKGFMPESIWRALGFSPFKFDSTWTGTSLSRNQIATMCNESGLTIKQYIDDPTHGTGDRIFLLLKPLKS
jgi:SAM-dependent methyltransferase